MMQRRKGNKSSKRAGGRKPPKGARQGVKPPSLEASISFGRTVRFTAANSGVHSITRAQLLNLLVMTTGANTAYRICDAVKVKKIRIWGNPPGLASAGIVPPCSVQWFSEAGPSKIVSDVGMGSTFGAKINTAPPQMSLAGFWSLTGTNEATVLFDIGCEAGDTIDVDLTFRIQNQFLTAAGAEAATMVSTTAAGTVGVVYGLSLDLNTTASLPPVAQKTLV